LYVINFTTDITVMAQFILDRTYQILSVKIVFNRWFMDQNLINNNDYFIYFAILLSIHKISTFFQRFIQDFFKFYSIFYIVIGGIKKWIEKK